MNHQPFEMWLVEDQPLSAAQKQQLQEHLQVCPACAALAETIGLLRQPPVLPAPPGFSQRFQQRLARQRARERAQRWWGMLLLLFAEVALLVWAFLPLISRLEAAPAQWLNVLVGYFLFLLTSLQAAEEVFAVAFRFLPRLLPPFFWMMLISALSGFALLWIFSIWRLSQRPRGV